MARIRTGTTDLTIAVGDYLRRGDQGWEHTDRASAEVKVLTILSQASGIAEFRYQQFAKGRPTPEVTEAAL